MFRSIAFSLACLLTAAAAQAQTDFRNALSLAFPATVTVATELDDVQPGIGRINLNQMPLPDQFQQQFGQAFQMMGGPVGEFARAGFAVSGDLIATDLPTGAETATITAPDGKSYDGKVVARDTVTGLALVQVQDYQFVSLVVGAGQPEAGTPVVVPQVKDGSPSSAMAMIASPAVSSFSRLGYAQHIDGNINASAVGAPVLNAEGVVVGVIGKSPSGQVCCLPTKHVLRLIDMAAGDGKKDANRGIVGVQFVGDGSPEIVEVSSQSPAAGAGILAGDRVVTVGEYETKSTRDVLAAVAMFRAGDEVTVTVQRDEELVEHTMTLGDYPYQRTAEVNNRPRGQRFEQAFRLGENGKLVPMDPGDGKKMMEDMGGLFRGFRDGELIVPQFRGRLEGFEVERSELEDAMRKLEAEKKEQADQIDDLKEKLRRLEGQLQDL